MKTTALVIGTATFVALAAAALPALATEHHDPQGSSADLLLEQIPLRPGVTSDIHVRVLENAHPRCADRTILAVHGATGAASNWEPLARAIFDERPGRRPVCRIAAIDLPGHGASPLPQGMLFGDLALDDYVTTVLATLDRLDARHLRVTTLMGHSQGGIVVQLAQQRLHAQGTDLREEHGIEHAVLFASVGPAALPWAFPSGGAGAALGPFIGFDPALGVRLAVPAEVWPYLVFTTPQGTLPANAPSPAEITAKGYDSPEPFTALAQLLGVPPFARPEVAPGVFSRCAGTRLDVVAFARDAIILPQENAALYGYLTGDDDLSGFTVVPGDDAVHGLIISNPGAIVDAIDGRVRF